MKEVLLQRIENGNWRAKWVVEELRRLRANELDRALSDVLDVEQIRDLCCEYDDVWVSDSKRLAEWAKLYCRGIGNGNQLLEMEELSMVGKGIPGLPTELQSLAGLRRLCLQWNHITTLPEEMSGLMSLQYLNLSCNHITHLPSAIGSLRNLKTLALRYNTLEHVPKQIAMLQKLEELHLDSNRLVSLPRAVVCMQSLHTLNLAHNRLRSVPCPSHLSMIETLDVSANYIKFIPPTFFADFPQLRCLGIAANPLCNFPVPTDTHSLKLSAVVVEEGQVDRFRNLSRLRDDYKVQLIRLKHESSLLKNTAEPVRTENPDRV